MTEDEINQSEKVHFENWLNYSTLAAIAALVVLAIIELLNKSTDGIVCAIQIFIAARAYDEHENFRAQWKPPEMPKQKRSSILILIASILSSLSLLIIDLTANDMIYLFVAFHFLFSATYMVFINRDKLFSSLSLVERVNLTVSNSAVAIGAIPVILLLAIIANIYGLGELNVAIIGLLIFIGLSIIYNCILLKEADFITEL